MCKENVIYLERKSSCPTFWTSEEASPRHNDLNSICSLLQDSHHFPSSVWVGVLSMECAKDGWWNDYLPSQLLTMTCLVLVALNLHHKFVWISCCCRQILCLCVLRHLWRSQLCQPIHYKTYHWMIERIGILRDWEILDLICGVQIPNASVD